MSIYFNFVIRIGIQPTVLRTFARFLILPEYYLFRSNNGTFSIY